MLDRVAGSPFRRQHALKTGGKTISACVFLLTLSGALNLWLINERLSIDHTQTHIIQQQKLIVSTTVTARPCPSVNCTSVCDRLKCRKPTLKQRTIGSLDAVSGVVGSAVADLKATANQISSPSESVTLFIGILSGRGYRHRRQAVRDAWASKCQVQGVSACRFVLSQEEVTPLVEEEMQQYQDIILVHGETNYKSILLKSLFVLEHAVTHYDARYRVIHAHPWSTACLPPKIPCSHETLCCEPQHATALLLHHIPGSHWTQVANASALC